MISGFTGTTRCRQAVEDYHHFENPNNKLMIIAIGLITSFRNLRRQCCDYTQFVLFQEIWSGDSVLYIMNAV